MSIARFCSQDTFCCGGEKRTAMKGNVYGADGATVKNIPNLNSIYRSAHSDANIISVINKFDA